MKKLFYITILSILCISCNAQTKLQKGRYNVNGKSLNIVETIGFTGKKSFGVKVEGRYKDSYPPPKNPNAFPVLKKISILI